MGFQNWESVMRHPVVGALWETYVIGQVVKHYHSRGKNALKKLYGDENIISGYIASRTAHPYTISGNIQAVPSVTIEQYITGH